MCFKSIYWIPLTVQIGVRNERFGRDSAIADHRGSKLKRRMWVAIPEVSSSALSLNPENQGLNGTRGGRR